MTPARLLDASAVADDWRLIRLQWHDPLPGPGQWLWMDIDGRRLCLPFRDGDSSEGWIAGVIPSALLPGNPGPGHAVSLSALQGEPLVAPDGQGLIILGQDLGIGPAMALAERCPEPTRLVVLGGQHGVPARLVPSRFYIPALVDCAIAGVGTLESLAVPSRIALTDERPGIYEGSPVDLLGRYLSDLPADQRQALAVVAIVPWGSLHGRQAGLAASVGGLRVVELPSP
jgi:hypothetical protein